jgi:hypothetical protein
LGAIAGGIETTKYLSIMPKCQKKECAVEVTFGSEARVRFKPSKAEGAAPRCGIPLGLRQRIAQDVSSALIGRGVSVATLATSSECAVRFQYPQQSPKVLPNGEWAGPIGNPSGRYVEVPGDNREKH